MAQSLPQLDFVFSLQNQYAHHQVVLCALQSKESGLRHRMVGRILNLCELAPFRTQELRLHVTNRNQLF